MFNITGQQKPLDIIGRGSKGPLLLMHDYSTDSIAWWKRSDTTKLAVGNQLALEGYDVWFSNYRGTKYSRAHTTLNADTNSEKYWDFDYISIAKNDVKAFVKKIVEVTRTCKKVTLVGHS